MLNSQILKFNLNNEENFQLNLYFDTNNDGIFNYADNDKVKVFSVVDRVNSNHSNQDYSKSISRFNFFIAAIRI